MLDPFGEAEIGLADPFAVLQRRGVAFELDFAAAQHVDAIRRLERALRALLDDEQREPPATA